MRFHYQQPLRIATLALTVAVAGLAQGADHRLGPLRHLDGSFPFTPPSSRVEWERRRDDVRRRVLVSQGLWPPPTKTPLAAVVHGTIDVPDPLAPGGGYTISKVYFESLPGFFVTGNLYKPRKTTGRVPGVLFAHGHHPDARLHLLSPDEIRREIAAGGERFERGGASLYQAMCVQLARMGCVAWQWDMLGDSDSRQLSRDLVHKFATQRPEMNGPERFGLFSPRAEARLITAMGLQTWNSIRSLDFLLSLPEVDPDRVAMTGSSGGGTQTMLLAAVDDRLAAAFPVVMVSTSMQGGCTCENASLLRIGTGNVELAALFAPKPQGMNTADDWTRELATKGFPELQAVYDLYGAHDRVLLVRGEHFPHNYNAVTRGAFHTFLNRHFGLGFPEPVIEHDFEPRTRPELSVWDADHPAPPAADPDFERALVTDLAADIDRQIRDAVAAGTGIANLLRPAFETLIGRSFAAGGDVVWEQDAADRDAVWRRMTGRLRNTTYDEEVRVTRLEPATPTGRVVVWLDAPGRAGSAARSLEGAEPLIAAGTTIVTADLSHTRDVVVTESGRRRQRTVDTPRDYAGYTFGYNDPAFVCSVHDLLTILRHLRSLPHGGPTDVAVVAFADAAPVALATRIVAGDAIDRMAVDTGGFRFASLDDWRHPLFLPGAVRYFDVPGMIAAGTVPLRLAGEPTTMLLGAGDAVERIREPGDSREATVAWLVESESQPTGRQGEPP